MLAEEKSSSRKRFRMEIYMVQDMTKGSPVKIILMFALPMLAGNIFQQFYNIVDSIVVSHGVGVNAFASVGCTSSMNFFIIGFVMGLCQGFSILISQYFGAGDIANLKKSAAMSIVLAVFSVVIVGVLAVIFSRGILTLMQTPDLYMADAVLYSRIVYGCIGCMVFYNLTSSILRALGDSRTPLISIIISCFVNIGLDLLFVFGFHWGVAGAAIATALAQLAATGFNLYRMKDIRQLKLSGKDFRIDLSLIKRMIVIGCPMAFQNSVTALGVMILQGSVNRLGPVYTVAYASGCKIVNIIQQPNATFGMTMATYVGQNLGGKQYDRIRQGVRKCILINLIICSSLCALMFLSADFISHYLIKGGEEGAIAGSTEYIIVLSCFLWILGLLWPYRSALQGMGRTIVPMLSGGLELVLRISLVLTLPLVFGFRGVMAAEISAWAGATLMIIIDYYRVQRRGILAQLSVRSVYKELHADRETGC